MALLLRFYRQYILIRASIGADQGDGYCSSFFFICFLATHTIVIGVIDLCGYLHLSDTSRLDYSSC